MEPLSCVTDAATLVENIYEIKSWVYNGQVQLVVPLSTYEHLEKLSQDYKEQILKRPDPQRQRSSSKPARKEFPAFDINIRVAEEFLARLKLEETKHHVTFQQPSEEYSPWKGVEAHVEKKDSKEHGPTTWAQAALTSLHNKTNSFNMGDTPKGPLKPKLVARSARTETSPWKTNKNAPKITSAEIPDNLRPLLSYTLWRIYENVATRADTNPSIILTDNFDTCDAARKLNIDATRVEELRHTIGAQKAAIDSNLFGDLERDFGIRESKAFPSQSGNSHVASTEDGLLYQIDHNQLEENGGDTEGEPVKIAVTSNEHKSGNFNGPQMNDNIHANSNGHSFIEMENQKAHKESCESPGSTEAIAFSTGSERSVSVITEQPSLPNTEDKIWIALDEPEILTKQVDGLQMQDSGLFTNQVNGLPRLEPEYFTHDTNGSRKPESGFFIKQTNRSNGQAPGSFDNKVDELAMLEAEFSPKEGNRLHKPGPGLFAKQKNGLHGLKPESLKRSNRSHGQEPEQFSKQVNGLHGRRTKKVINAYEYVSSQSLPTANIDIAQEASNKLDTKMDIPPGINTNSPENTVASKEKQTAQLPTSLSQPRKSPVKASAKIDSKPASSRSPSVSDSISAQVDPEPEDSDEEVVVFSPKSKRLSAQKTPPRQTNDRPPIRANHAQQKPQLKAPLIDPDAFGRSDAIGPPYTTNTRAHVQNWQYPRYPPRGNPRHVPRNNESEVDFVLKSGAPRGASRGQGKLWVP